MTTHEKGLHVPQRDEAQNILLHRVRLVKLLAQHVINISIGYPSVAVCLVDEEQPLCNLCLRLIPKRLRLSPSLALI